jgi:hypothetical protein
MGEEKYMRGGGNILSKLNCFKFHGENRIGMLLK